MMLTKNSNNKKNTTIGWRFNVVADRNQLARWSISTRLEFVYYPETTVTDFRVQAQVFSFI